MLTMATAVNDCMTTDAKDSVMPRRQVSSLVKRYEEIAALPCPGPAAWKIP